jgi:dipeptidyl aminopeptidase/acylaminoacyl peptidase
MAQPFDPTRWNLAGRATAVQRRIDYGARNAWVPFDVSGTGTLIFSNESEAVSELRWFDRKGKPVQGYPAVQGVAPSLSPDGKRLVMYDPPNPGIFLLDLLRGTKTRLTSNGADGSPYFSPDGNTLVFSRNDDLFTKSIDDMRPEQSLGQSNVQGPTGWSPKGDEILYTRFSDDRMADVWVLPLTGDRKPRPVIQTRYNERTARFSPDGKAVAYASDVSGRSEIFITDYPAAVKRRQISGDGGINPVWRKDGRELFFLTPDPQTMMAVDVQPGDSLASGIPRVLFALPPSAAFYFDVTGDGQQFVIAHSQIPFEIVVNVILNWPGLIAH